MFVYYHGSLAEFEMLEIKYILTVNADILVYECCSPDHLIIII